MSFRKEVQATPNLEAAYCKGLHALERGDRARIKVENPRSIAGSVNLDHHLRPGRPNDPVWDYAVAVENCSGKEFIHWIEVHPANGSGKVAEVRKKAEWLSKWLNSDGKRLKRDRGGAIIVWIASGSSPLGKGAPQLRALAQLGVLYVGEHYTLCQKRMNSQE